MKVALIALLLLSAFPRFFSMSTAQLSAIRADLQAAIPAMSSNRASNQVRADLIGGMLRLPFHDAFGQSTKPDGCLDPSEADHNGLSIVRAVIDPICLSHSSYCSRADCWVLGGSVAISAAGGLPVPFRYGRLDCPAETAGVDAGLLPSARPDGNPWHHVLDVFNERARFAVREIVALMGAHSLGRPSSDPSSNSGFSSIPWVPGGGGNPGGLLLSNAFYQGIVNVPWTRNVDSAKEGEWDHTVPGTSSPDTLMLDTDMSLVFDTSSCSPRNGVVQFGGGAAGQPPPPPGDFNSAPRNANGCSFNNEPYDEVAKYGADNDLFLSDFSAAIQKMTELGWSTWKIGGAIQCTSLCEVTDSSFGKVCELPACTPLEVNDDDSDGGDNDDLGSSTTASGMNASVWSLSLLAALALVLCQ